MLTSCLYFTGNDIDRLTKFQQFNLKLQFKIFDISLHFREKSEYNSKNKI